MVITASCGTLEVGMCQDTPWDRSKYLELMVFGVFIDRDIWYHLRLVAVLVFGDRFQILLPAKCGSYRVLSKVQFLDMSQYG